jgi:hypothetical protein
MTESVHIVFAPNPRTFDLTFVEVETPQGVGLNRGEWVTRDDGYRCLELELAGPPEKIAVPPEGAQGLSAADIDALVVLTGGAWYWDARFESATESSTVIEPNPRDPTRATATYYDSVRHLTTRAHGEWSPMGIAYLMGIVEAGRD